MTLEDLQTAPADELSVTESWFIEESLLASQPSSIFCEHLISLDETAIDEIVASHTTETPDELDYDNTWYDTQWHVSFDRRILEFYPRVDDKETWAYGVRTLLGQVDIFLQTGSAFFTHSEAGSENRLTPPLRAAYGVCSSYRLRAGTQFPFYQQLLENEVENLLSSRSSYTLQEKVAELCAMLLYYIIINFGGTLQRGQLAEKSEALLAQHTARVESLELATRQSTTTLIQAELLSKEEGLSLWHACDNARKVVVVSYLAREIHHVLRHKTCYLLRHIVALPVSKNSTCTASRSHGTEDDAHAQWQDVGSYDGFVRDWEAGELGVADTFTHFLIATCKGINAL